MKTLAENNGYRLCYESCRVNKFIVFKSALMGISGELKFSQTVAQSPIFSKKLKSYFTKQQVQTAIAKVHAIKFISKST